MDIKRFDKIIEMSKHSDKINATNNNSKTGPACLCVNFPMCACRPDAPCKKGCYCAKGRQQSDNVLQAYYRNLRLYKADPVQFFKDLDITIKYNGLPLFRFFDCGDIPDAKFFDLSIKLVKKNKGVKFLMYTKKYDIVNNFINNGGKIPSNLVVRFSYWSNDWAVNNPHNLPVAMVDFKDKSKNLPMPSNAYKCKCDGVTCSQCKMCFNSKVKTIIFDQH